MTDDLAAWLKSKLDERERELAENERAALAATAAPWMPRRADRSVYAQETSIVMGGHDGGWFVVPHDGETREGIEPGDAEHIARHDPARVLAEVKRGRRDIAGKQRLLELHGPPGPRQPTYACSSNCLDDRQLTQDRPCTTVLALAQEFEGERGWQEEWKA